MLMVQVSGRNQRFKEECLFEQQIEQGWPKPLVAANLIDSSLHPVASHFALERHSPWGPCLFNPLGLLIS